MICKEFCINSNTNRASPCLHSWFPELLLAVPPVALLTDVNKVYSMDGSFLVKLWAHLYCSHTGRACKPHRIAHAIQASRLAGSDGFPVPRHFALNDYSLLWWSSPVDFVIEDYSLALSFHRLYDENSQISTPTVIYFVMH